jgi:uncharacterized damage-inducible protein DinB
MSLHAIRRLFAHMRWADERALQSLREAPGRHAQRATDLYAHILGAEQVWLARLRQAAPTVAVWPQLTLDACAALAAETHHAWDAYLAGVGEAGLRAEVAYVNSAGQAFRSSVEDILLHVALHGTYHRGQVALTVRDGGGTPVPTDFIALARGAPAATRQG